MSLLGGCLYSPELATCHPVTITPLLNAGDARRSIISKQPSTDEINLPEAQESGPVNYTKTEVSSGDSPGAYDITWEKMRGAKYYRLYGSMSPAGHGILIQDNLQYPETVFHVPYFSEVVAYFFWVAGVGENGKEYFLTDAPASLMASAEKTAFLPGSLTNDPLFPGMNELNRMLGKGVEFIRSADRLQLELNGEPAYLFLRRYAEDRPWGTACSCTDKGGSDPDYVGKGRCKLCFGTGILGGFLPKIGIMIRYGSAPEQLWKWTKRGHELQHGFNTYMLRNPVVRVGDLVVRAVDGSRYLVTKTKPDISVQGVRLHQEFDLQQIENTDILQEVTDTAIQKNLERAQLPGYVREGYRIFG